MVDEAPEEDRSSEAIAYGWVARVMSMSSGMVIPMVFGYGIDRLVGLKACFIFIGLALGMTIGVWQLARLSRPAP